MARLRVCSMPLPETIAAIDRPIDAAIGRSIYDTRRARQLQRRELAAALGVSTLEMARIEAGQRRAAAVQLFVIARTLAVPLASFYRAEGLSPGCSAATQSAKSGTLFR